MSQKTEKAVNNYKNGYTCAQAVACAFCEEAGIDEKTMFRLTEAQGVGLGGHGGIIQGQLFEKRPVAGGPGGTVQGGPDAFSMDGGKVRDGGAGQAPAFGFGHNGRPQGVLRRIFHTGGGL